MSFVTTLGKLFRTTAVKLTLVYLAVFTALLVGLILYISTTAGDLLDRQLRETIDAEIRGLSEQYRSSGLRGLVNAVERRSVAPGASLYLITDFAGNRIAGNIDSLEQSSLSTPDGEARPVQYTRLVGPDEEASKPRRALVRVFVLPGGFRLLVGRDMEERFEFRAIILQASQWALLAAIVLGLVSFLAVSRRVLKRIDAISEASNLIVAGDLESRLPMVGTGDEFDRLSGSLNAMLDRIEQLHDGLSRVSDNIAHDLKTPLTRLRMQAEVALSQADSEEALREALQATMEESQGLIRTFDALLMIARAEAGSARVTKVSVDLAQVALDVAELYEPVAEEAGVELTVDVPDDAIVQANRELVGQAIANLIDNAIKHGGNERESARVSVTLTPDPARVAVTVTDNGPGIPAEDRDRVTGRFVRLEASRTTPGSGLGLSLVEAIANVHKGRLELGDAGPGLKATLVFPRLGTQLPSER
ncbi:sensor histidine kinase [Amorphus orientalis]|uniref:histidine kinase n=1 Tax=Amorphus orientalis TaxID=649198 RepID=A0AAE3VNG1_9HYPH|nr:ATP-binding protein [Amorphus orientalis]MDQ0315138.1 signal transduction histidine kinase [Amorphus orientalis]